MMNAPAIVFGQELVHQQELMLSSDLQDQPVSHCLPNRDEDADTDTWEDHLHLYEFPSLLQRPVEQLQTEWERARQLLFIAQFRVSRAESRYHSTRYRVEQQYYEGERLLTGGKVTERRIEVAVRQDSEVQAAYREVTTWTVHLERARMHEDICRARLHHALVLLQQGRGQPA